VGTVHPRAGEVGRLGHSALKNLFEVGRQILDFGLQFLCLDRIAPVEGLVSELAQFQQPILQVPQEHWHRSAPIGAAPRDPPREAAGGYG